MNRDGGRVDTEGGAESVMEVEVSRPGDVVEVGVE